VSYDTARPYLACFVILRKDNKVAFILRSNTDWMNGYYGLPAGKVEEHESAAAGAVREAFEETGVTVKATALHPIHVSHRWASDDTFAWIDVLFEATIWEGEPFNAEPDKHSDLAWLDPKNLPENIIPAVRFYIEQIEAGKTYSEYGWPT
jgi:8-oxo-dGTP diphosphatase